MSTSNPSHNLLLRHNIKALKLPTMLAEHDKLARRRQRPPRRTASTSLTARDRPQLLGASDACYDRGATNGMSDEADHLEDVGDDDTEQPELFAFIPEDKLLITAIVEGVRDIVAQRFTSPGDLRQLSVALLALERLPRPTPGVELGVSLINRVNDEMSYIGFYIGSSSFRVESGGSVYDPGVGSDSYGSTILEVEPSGFRCSDGWSALSNWAEMFKSRCLDAEWLLSFEWLGDDSEVNWEDDGSGDAGDWDRLDAENGG